MAAAVRGIWKKAELTIYDIAHRIGAHLGLAPERVYLHCGTRVGARALGLGRGRDALELRELPDEFQRLTAAEAEDCLCIYKAFIKTGRRRLQDATMKGWIRTPPALGSELR